MSAPAYCHCAASAAEQVAAELAATAAQHAMHQERWNYHLEAMRSIAQRRATLFQLREYYAEKMSAERGLTPQPPTRCRADAPEAQPQEIFP